MVLSALQAKASVMDKFTTCLFQELKNKPDLEPALAYDAGRTKIEIVELSPSQKESLKKFLEIGESQDKNFAQLRRCQDKVDLEFFKKKNDVEKIWAYEGELSEFATDKKLISLNRINSGLYQVMQEGLGSSLNEIKDIYVTSEQEKSLNDLNECYEVKSTRDCVKNAAKILASLRPSVAYSSIVQSRLDVFLDKKYKKIRGKNCQKEIADQEKLKTQIQSENEKLKSIFVSLGYKPLDIYGFSFREVEEILKGKKTIVKVSYELNTEDLSEIKNEIAQLNKIEIKDRDFKFYKNQTRLFGLIKAFESKSTMYLYDKAGLVTRAKIGISVRDEDKIRCNSSSSKSFLYNSSSGSR